MVVVKIVTPTSTKASSATIEIVIVVIWTRSITLGNMGWLGGWIGVGGKGVVTTSLMD